MNDKIDELPPGRKIDLDRSKYCSKDFSFNGGDNKCDHDYDFKPSAECSNYVEWTCTRCKGKLRIGVME